MEDVALPTPPASTVPIAASALAQWRREALAQGQSAQGSDGAGPGELELDWLLRALAGLDRRWLRQADPDQTIALPCGLAELGELWRRHCQDHVPLQYLVGRSPWRRFDLQVSPAVLVPRPETELIVEIAQQIAQAQNLQQGTWADLGTGSGAIALGLAELLPNITLHALDASPAALAVAAANIAHIESGAWASRIQLHQGNWFAPLGPGRGQLQGLVSNPPYIPTAALADLQLEVRLHEPSLALDGGTDGLDSLRHLVTVGADYLQPGGLWLVELMAGQAPAVQAMLTADGRYSAITPHRDLAGIERFVSALRRNEPIDDAV